MVDPHQQRGINCRFGMKGVIAELHYDQSRNFIVVMNGQRRYILAHPKECAHLYLYPLHHPSGRHSAVDWIAPNLTQFPNFHRARVNELVLQAGDALYLPTYWFHFIVSLNLNYQCNARSGMTHEHDAYIQHCGFPIAPE
jgi:ribosomal protein L16 Arg81 hydroxylase